MIIEKIRPIQKLSKNCPKPGIASQKNNFRLDQDKITKLRNTDVSQSFKKILSFLKPYFSMNSLHSKIQEAATLFQTHDFKKSLQLYEQCINMCRKNQEPKTLLYNILSSKGALMSILGDQKGALETLNEVLKQDPYHPLCLMRRSQVFKKKNQLNKALKDLKLLSNFSPDNLQIAAMKVQVQNLKMKCKQVNSSSSESESEESDDADEEQKLNFSNLKVIDRKSVSIMIRPEVSRKSRVTIAGDIAIEYDAIQDDEKDTKSFASTNVSKEYVKDKFIKTFRQIQLDDEDQKSTSNKSIEMPVPKIKPVAPRGKSILKNRNSTLYINNEKPLDKEKKYGGRESKMIDLLKNIDGKVISNTCSERSSKQFRQVEFRKSIFGGSEQIKSLSLNTNNQAVSTNAKGKGARKSCLKRSSFELPKQETKGVSNQGPRRSKFDMMPKNGIDGIVIKSKRMSTDDQGVKQNVKNDSDSDEGSEHNIFGSKQFVISRQVRENLGLGEDSTQVKIVKKETKSRTTGGKSILKKNSILMKSVQKSKESSPLKEVKKAKKSVMFTKFE